MYLCGKCYRELYDTNYVDVVSDISPSVSNIRIKRACMKVNITKSTLSQSSAKPCGQCDSDCFREPTLYIIENEDVQNIVLLKKRKMIRNEKIRTILLELDFRRL